MDGFSRATDLRGVQPTSLRPRTQGLRLSPIGPRDTERRCTTLGFVVERDMPAEGMKIGEVGVCVYPELRSGSEWWTTLDHGAILHPCAGISARQARTNSR